MTTGTDRSRRRQRELVDRQFSDHDAVHVANAGLVILGPFLEQLFTSLDLLVDQGFGDLEAAERAASLLHHLATGQVEPPLEHAMVLNKVLCGIGIEAVLEPGPPLTGREIDRCEQLLVAVIAAAPGLGIRSIDGLRGTYLLRHGRLATLGGGWHLQVERVTYDIVLERLPWDIEWTHLPWMTAPLRVDW